MSKEKNVDVTEILDKPFYNYQYQPPKVIIKSNKPSKVQESPLDARSPQEVLEQHGLYKSESNYSKHPEKIYADLSTFGDYESNLRAIRSMQEKFDALDVDVRARFNHDVNEFTKYVTSKDFDISRVLTDKELDSYKKYKENEKNALDYQKYINSDEYKTQIAEMEAMRAFQRQQYEEWKKNLKSN